MKAQIQLTLTIEAEVLDIVHAHRTTGLVLDTIRETKILSNLLITNVVSTTYESVANSYSQPQTKEGAPNA
jgi:hypothetical protein